MNHQSVFEDDCQTTPQPSTKSPEGFEFAPQFSKLWPPFSNCTYESAPFEIEFFCRSKADPPPLEKGIFINAFSLKHFHRIRDFFFSSDCDNEKLTSVESWFKLCSTLN